MSRGLGTGEGLETAGYAADCARRALSICEQSLPADTRPRDAIDAAHAFRGR
ncbi:putative immunity protein [Streptomyces inhibens]|uniref:putative immunity protein n=1 Tax=Streptomyces inhibens TaxID=2293571 RepID=UPI0037BA731E